MQHGKSSSDNLIPSWFSTLNKNLLITISLLIFAGVFSACGGGSSSTAPPIQNQAPIAMDDSVDVAAGSLFTVDVLSNDSDANNDSLTLMTVTQPAHGTVQLINNSVIYQSELTFKGTDSFSYTVSDGEFEASATVSINVLFDELDPDSLTAFGGILGQPTYSGDYLYIAQGSIISVWDMSQPQAPQHVFDTGNKLFSTLIVSLTIVDNYLYAIVEGEGLAVFSLDNPTEPILVKVFDYDPTLSFDTPNGIIQLSDNQLYLIDSTNGIYLIDISNPESPIATNVLNIAFGADKLKIFDSLLIVSFRNTGFSTTFVIVDISVVEAPSIVSFKDGISFAFNQTTLIRGDGFTLQFFDLAIPSEPVLIAEFASEGAALAINNTTAYIRTRVGIEFYDISTPATPTLIHSVNLDIGIIRQHLVSPFGLVLFSDDDKGVLLDVFPPEQTSLVSNFNISGGTNVEDVAFNNNVTVALQLRYGITTHQPDDFSQLGRLDIDLPDEQIGTASLKVEDNIAYIANWNFGLNIVDISDSASPTNIGKLNLGSVSDIAVDPNSQIALLGQSTDGGGLYVVDIANPAQPQLIAEYTFSPVRVVEFYNGHFLVGSTGINGGLSILDLSNPTALTVLGHYSCSHGILNIATSNNKALIVCNSELRIVDISQPASPTLIGKFSSGNYSNFGTIAVSGNRVFLGYSNGLDEINIADPTDSRLIKTIPLPSTPMRLKVSPQGLLYNLAGYTNFILKDKE